MTVKLFILISYPLYSPNLKACRIIWRYSKNSIIYKRRSNLGCLSRSSKCKNQEPVITRGSYCNSNRTFLLGYRRFTFDFWRKWCQSTFYSWSLFLCSCPSLLYHVIWVSWRALSGLGRSKDDAHWSVWAVWDVQSGDIWWCYSDGMLFKCKHWCLFLLLFIVQPILFLLMSKTVRMIDSAEKSWADRRVQSLKGPDIPRPSSCLFFGPSLCLK